MRRKSEKVLFLTNTLALCIILYSGIVLYSVLILFPVLIKYSCIIEQEINYFYKKRSVTPEILSICRNMLAI
ncbi:predicted protein [Methanosarcina acetivorans C2A]|uniref:Uncharacterized protein n=1 Tax=Methanosarcina acetivorans (strain ATCC 35395 / DSM 2834 / JCM 12185 / C2A) TaxID=188937 RepID=Q8TJ08_METAC|nr:predicted protein [Methanosarcina acetivorans C2A]